MKLKMRARRKLKKTNVLSKLDSKLVFGGQVTKGEPKVAERQYVPPPPPPAETVDSELKITP